MQLGIHLSQARVLLLEASAREASIIEVGTAGSFASVATGRADAEVGTACGLGSALTADVRDILHPGFWFFCHIAAVFHVPIFTALILPYSLVKRNRRVLLHHCSVPVHKPLEEFTKGGIITAASKPLSPHAVREELLDCVQDQIDLVASPLQAPRQTDIFDLESGYQPREINKICSLGLDEGDQLVTTQRLQSLIHSARLDLGCLDFTNRRGARLAQGYLGVLVFVLGPIGDFRSL
mmetsp:Transcript_6375/g.17755  ORF Transcript_6375/g.17755 Transcript_6375/m.17755 type:complete len:237 (+) Transcript_6375:299-1009(+)